MTYSDDMVALLFADSGVIDVLEAWSEITDQEASILATMQTTLAASGNTNASQDLAFKQIFDRYFMSIIG